MFSKAFFLRVARSLHCVVKSLSWDCVINTKYYVGVSFLSAVRTSRYLEKFDIAFNLRSHAVSKFSSESRSKYSRQETPPK